MKCLYQDIIVSGMYVCQGYHFCLVCFCNFPIILWICSDTEGVVFYVFHVIPTHIIEYFSNCDINISKKLKTELLSVKYRHDLWINSLFCVWFHIIRCSLSDLCIIRCSFNKNINNRLNKYCCIDRTSWIKTPRSYIIA